MCIRIEKRDVQCLHRHLSTLAQEFGINTEDTTALHKMFKTDNTYVAVYEQEFQYDFAFSFWGYVRSDTARKQLLKVLHCCMRPRVYIMSETLPGHHMEGCMILKLDRLRVTRAAFEDWLDAFFGMLNISAGLNVFQQYMGTQMICCMTRIHLGKKIVSNLFAIRNRDFLMLYKHLRQSHVDKNRVREFTRTEFTADNFINAFVQEVLRRDGVINSNNRLRRIPDSQDHEYVYGFRVFGARQVSHERQVSDSDIRFRRMLVRNAATAPRVQL